ncbi:MAG: hypothetical protein AAFP84_04825 [Actinomycetota bacterium]
MTVSDFASLPAPDPNTRAAKPAVEIVPPTHSSHVEPTPASPPDTTATNQPGTSGSSWRRALTVGLVAYALSRFCVMVGTAVRASQRAVDARLAGFPEPATETSVTDALTSWDGLWYLAVAREGYPTSIPDNVNFEQIEARAAFFPLFPGAIRFVDAILPGGDTLAALVLNVILGGLAVVLVGLLARDVYDDTVAMRAMVLFAVFPGSFVLSFAYAEALMIVFAGSCLLFLRDQRWVLAGLAAMLTTATRPNGIAIIVACAIAAFVAIRRRGDWSALAAPLLAPIGFLGFMVYVDVVSGERGAWLRVQTEAWDEGVSFGATAVRTIVDFVTHPLGSPTGALTLACVLTTAFIAWASIRARLPWEWVAYSAVIIAMVLLPDTVTIRPRFVLAAFPLFIGVAAWWPTTSRSDQAPTIRVWDAVILISGAGLVGLTGLYASLGAIP